MTKKTIFIACFLAVLTSCSSPYSYEYIQVKNEGDNKMILYTCGENFNTQTLLSFCKDQKTGFYQGINILVFFDKKDNAVFPNNPVTALFMDEAPMRHIRAVYTFNNSNGYSKLSTYEKNMWESKAKEIDI